MRALSAFFALAVAVASPGAATAASQPPRVTVDTGALSGVAEGDVLAFRGIPYAAPPVGEGRWRAPAPARPWTGVRQATAYGAACPQEHVHAQAWAQVGPTSEDCLFLNVWRPVKPGRYPVMVFIHGGGFTYGAAGVPLYDGANLARHGVVLVTMNYRLGRLGFFAHPALTREDPDGLLGNYALMDQIAALKWVRRNISAFGGDPANVTLFGESAGAGSVNIFMSSPEARGLFQKAISESGSGEAALAPIRGGPRSAEAAGVRWAESLGLHDPTPAQLRAIPLAQIIQGRGFPFIDGRVVVKSPGDAYRAGDEMRIPLITGSNTHEATLPSNNEAHARRVLGPAYPELLAAYQTQAGDSRTPPGVELAEQALSVQATLFTAEAHAGHGAPTFAYMFGQVPVDARATSLGAGHGGEVAYLFDTQPAGERWDASDREVSRLMGDYWTNFAKTGTPSARGASGWVPVGARPTAVLAIGTPTRMTGSTPLEERTRDVALKSAERRWDARDGGELGP